MSGKTQQSGSFRAPLIFSVIEDLRRKGYNQSEIADMHGVTRQAVSWQKKTYGGRMTPRDIVREAWPFETTNLHGKSVPFQRLRDHGEFMATGERRHERKQDTTTEGVVAKAPRRRRCA
ncbi:immunity repressor [Mycobacterium phage PainterBoy]|nr:immunity repressor [Mycobacterium phage PainterBoy]